MAARMKKEGQGAYIVSEVLVSVRRRSSSSILEMYALSDFLIMVFVMVSEAVT